MHGKHLLSLFSILIINVTALLAQEGDSTVIVIDEVMVTGVRESNPDRTSLHLNGIGVTTIQQHGAFNLSDALAQQPGISQLSTGPGISKPVIRGLYGNRVLVLVSSMKFDNQQWQDEHGLGLSEVGVKRLELITGPAAVLYGSDAIGGVINVIEDVPLPQERSITISNRFYSNTLGNATDISWKKQRDNHWLRLVAGYETHADYADGNNDRVLNSRFTGVYAKAGAGFEKNNWRSSFNYHFSLNQFGFILPDLGSFFTPDARWSRSMEGPHHIVMFNLLAWENRVKLKNSTLKLNLGFQSNQRKEDEGGGSISLNMHLLSVPYSVQWIHRVSGHMELIVSHIGTFENNTNYGGRVLIPDANMLEEGVAVFIKESREKFVYELGVGGHIKFIKTFATGILNTDPDKEIQPFATTKSSVNGMAGISYLPNKHWVIKTNASTGHRAPNLAELSSNGLHEGTYQYEIGDPGLKNEQNLNAEVSVAFASSWIDVSASAYFNHFFSYIYLTPTAEEYFGFQIYRYLQDQANLAGGEAVLKIHPAPIKGLEWKQTFSLVKGWLLNGENLPYIPANKWAHELRYTSHIKDKVRNAYVFVSCTQVFQKDEVAPGETVTPQYFLLGAGVGGSIKVGQQYLDIFLSGNNLLNKTYTSHLSRLKAYGINNMGRNLMLTIRIPIYY